MHLKLYNELVKKFQQKLKDMSITPKIVIFTSNRQNFLQNNKEYEDYNIFYKYGGIFDKFNEIKEFIIKDIKVNYGRELIKSNDSDIIQLSFEYIDKKEKLLLPIFFKSLIDSDINDNIEDYTKLLYKKYSKDNKEMQALLGSIKSMKNIPIEILSKYYIRLYSAKSNFFKNINKDLNSNKIEEYLPFIQTLYYGLNIKSFPVGSSNELYKYTRMSNDEINIIKKYLEKKIENVPSSIMYSKSFLLFTKDKNIVDEFLINENIDKNLSKVLLILEKDDNIGYNLATHCDIENIAFFPEQKEVLFFPFSCFEIKDLKEIIIGENEKGYEINLLYLSSRYLNEIENDTNIITNDNILPESEFKKQLSASGLIQKEKLENITINKLFNEFKNLEKDINENNFNRENIITGEINITPNDIYKTIRIINTFENMKRMDYYNEDKPDDWKYENEKKIKENVEIKINGKLIEFSFTHKFIKEGKYKIKYSFQKNLTKTNYLFYKCRDITSLNLSKFNSENVTDMSHMFYSCKSLKNIKLSELKTKNVTNMSNMFNKCHSLTNLDLSNFNTKNVTDMSYMFFKCNNLSSINLSNFNTKNVIDISNMFFGCISLKNLDLSSFNILKVQDMGQMFCGCKSLNKLDLSNFNTENVIIMVAIFYGCNSLKKINVITKDEKIMKKLNINYN